MKPKLFLLSCLALGAGVSFAAKPADGPVEIKSDLKIGKRYAYEMTTNQSVNMEVAGEKMDQKMTMSQGFGMEIRAADGGKKEMTTEYGEMSMKMSMNGEQVDTLQQGDPFAAIKGQKFKAILGAGDQVEKIEGLDAIIEKVSGSAPGMEQMFTEDNMKEMVRQSNLASFPEKPVSPGDSWEFSVDLPLGPMGKGSVKGTYTYVGQEEIEGSATAKIKVEGTVAMKFGEGDEEPKSEEEKQMMEEMKQMGMKITESKMEGTTYFDPAIGAIRLMEMDQSFTMSMKPPGAPGEMSIPIKQKIKMSLKAFEDLED